ELRHASVVIDAIVGTGFRGRLVGRAASAAEAINQAGRPVVAVDIPSGVEGATGAVNGPAVRAAVTVTMGAIKVGLVLYPGSEHAGSVEVADIGIEPKYIQSRLSLVEEADVRAALPRRPADAHKRSVGTSMIVAGSVGMSGAAALAARGALRAGAGLVTMAAPSSVALPLDQTVLEATTLRLPETGRGTIEPSAVDAVLSRAAAVDAVALGPGLTTDPETVEFVGKLVAGCDRPLLLDADGINALAGRPEALAGRSAPTLMTPHPGELGRLLGISTAEVSADRIASALRAAGLTRSVALLKGYRTVVAAPSGEAVVIPVGGPALATGGAGDVLTGVAVALLASGMDPFPAGWCAAWIHGRAGDLMAERMGVRGGVAGDLPEAVAEVLRRLEASA
ncbi:MAG: NAD(P)H-hydrate dehydratase, partial [Actinomycetota bacterium]